MLTAFDGLLDAVPFGVLVMDAACSILVANPPAAELLGHGAAELTGGRLDELLAEPGRRRLVEASARLFDGRAGGVDELQVSIDNGRQRSLWLALRRVTHAGQAALLITARAGAPPPAVPAPPLDGEGRQMAERALRESEARHRALFESSPVALVELDLSATRAFLAELEATGLTELADAHFDARPEMLRAAAASVETVAVNESALELFEASDAAWLGDAMTLFGPDTLPWLRAALRELWSGRRHFDAETTTRTSTGASRAVSMRIHLLPGHTETWSRAVVSLFDLTAHQRAEERLRASLREKEVLLREVHHRVKNNLQIVSSLLNLKADTIANAAAQQVFADCQTRIRSLAFVHEHLYVASDLSHVPFGQYVRTLAAHLEHSFRRPDLDVSVRVSVGELNLSIDDAIPCGLIVNELVTNALKHAFAPGSAGAIEIRMRRLPGQRLELSVSDDGRGLPSGIDPLRSGGSGLDLVYTFAEQLEAEVGVDRQGGTRFTFRFSATRARPPAS